MGISNSNTVVESARTARVMDTPQRPNLRQSRPNEEMRGLLRQVKGMVQQDMLTELQQKGGSEEGPKAEDLDQLQQQLDILKTIDEMQDGGDAPAVPDCQKERNKPAQQKPPKTEQMRPAAGPSVDQAKVNDEKLHGIANHKLGPDDDLLPPDERNKSVSELKDIKTADGSQKYGLMANLGNQEGMKDKLKSVVGDVDNDPKAFARGEAYLQKIKHMPNPDGSQRPNDMVNNGKIEGCTKSGDIRSGTEAAALKDSFKGGPQVADKNAPSSIDKGKAYGWLNDQKALSPTNDKHVVNGGNARGDAQVFFMNVGENIKKGFKKIGEGFKLIGEGIKNFAEGAIHAIGSAVKVVGGALTGNRDLIHEGAKGFKDGASQAWHSVDTTIKGTGEVLGGAAGALVSASPVGMAINQTTGNAASRLASGVPEGLADTLVKGRNGPIKFVEGAAEGNLQKALKGGYDFANMGTMFIPGAGEANMARVVGTNMAKEGIKESAKDEAKNQYNENKNGESQQA